MALTIDSGSSNSDRLTNIGTLVVSGVEAGATVQYSINGGATWTGSFTPVEGANTVLARQINSAGNVSVAIPFSFILDTVAPGAPTIVSVTENPVINASEASNGTPILVDLTGIGAMIGNKLTIHWGGQTVEYTLQASDITSLSATVTVPAATIAAQGDGTFNVTAQLVDAAGNVSASSTNYALTVDTVVPGLPAVALVSDTGSSNSDHITNVGTLALSGIEAGATVQYSTHGDANWSSSFAVVEGPNTVLVRQVDLAGNAGTATTFSFVLDTANPSVVVDIVDASLSDGNNSSQVTFTFNEAVSDVMVATLASGAGITVVGGTVSALTWNAAHTVATAIFTATDGITDAGSVTVAAGSYADVAGNPGSTGSDTVSIDTANPSVSTVTASDTLITDSDTGAGKTFTVTVVFDQAMNTGVDPTLTFGPDVSSTLTFAGGSWSAGGTTYTATYNVADANVNLATVTVDVTGAQDANGNAQADYTPQAEVSIDTANPSVSTVTASDTLITDSDTGAGKTFTVTVVFDQAMNTGVDPTLTFGPDVSSTLTFAGGSWSAGGTTYTATYNVADANVNLATVTVDVTGAQDANGNAQADYTPQAEVSIDTANPSVSTVTASDTLITDSDTGAGKTFTVTVVFDQAMNTGVDPTLTFGPDVSSTLTFAGGSWSAGGTTYTATYNVADANVNLATVTVDVTGAQDANGNAQADYTPQAEVSIDTANPSVSTVTASDTLITDSDTGAGKTFTVTVVFDQAMNTGVDPTLTFGPDVSSTLTFAGGSWSAGGTTYTATYNVADANVNLATVTVDVTGAQDANGNAQADYTPQAEVSIDTANPSVSTVTASDTLITDSDTGAGKTFTVTVVFDQAMNTGVDPTLTFGPDVSSTLTFAGGSWSAGGTTYTATYNVADANVNLATVTVDVTGAQDANGNAQADYTPQAEVSIDTANPSVSTVTASDTLITDSDTGAGKTFTVTVVFDQAMNTGVDPTLTFGPDVSSTLTFAGGSWSAGGTTYTATYNVADANVNLATVTVDVTGAQDANGNAQADYTPQAEVSIDTANPSVSTVTASDTLITDSDTGAGKTFTVTVVFDQAMNTGVDPTLTFGPDVSSTLTFAGGSWSAGGTTYTATYNVADANVNLATVTVDVTGAQDANGNAQADYTPQAEVSIDTANPSVSTVTASDTLITDSDTGAGKTFTVTVVFDQAMNTGVDPTLTFGPDVSSTLTFAGGSWSAGGTTYTATYNVADANVNLATVTVDVTGAQDANGNAQADYTPQAEVSIDTANPSVSTVTASDTLITDSDTGAGKTFTVTVVFDQAMNTGVDPTLTFGPDVSSTLTFAGGSWSAGGTTYTATYNVADANVNLATVTVDVTGAQDANGNAQADYTPQAEVSIDTANPSVSTVTASDTLITDSDTGAGKTFTVTVVFDQAMNTGVDPTLTFGPDVSSTLTFAGGSWSAGGTTYTATYNVADANVNLATVTVDVTGAQDANGNAQADYTPQAEVSIDTANPSVSTVTASDTLITDSDTGAGKTFTVTVVFDQAMNTGVDPTLTFGPDVSSTLTFAGGSWSAGGTTYTATYNVADANVNLATVTVDVTGAQDANGNAQTDYTPQAEVSIDTANPSATIVVADTVLQAGETSLVTITFSEAVSGLTTGALTVENGTLTNLSSSDGITWTATLTPTANIEDATNVITLNNTGVQDAAGNTGVGTTTSNNYAVDTLVADPNDFDDLATGTTVITIPPYVYGTPVNNKITGGGNSGQIIYAGAGDDDPLNGTGANDIIYGGSGNDNIKGNGDTDIIFGGSGADTIDGSGGKDVIYGGFGADTLQVGSDDDIVVYLSVANFHGGEGQFDTITGFSSGDKIDLTAFGPTAFQNGVNTLSATSLVAAHTIAWFYDGTQTIIYANPTDGLNGSGSSLLEIHLTGVQSVQPSDFLLASTDPLIGSSGPDTIDGTSGNDIIYGGLGQDNLSGGGGIDTFKYVAVTDSPGALFDTITDFGSTDQIDLRAFGAGAFTTFKTTQLATNLVAAHTIAYSIDGGTTIIYANPTDHALIGGSPDLLEIQLAGVSSIQITNFLTANILIAAAPQGWLASRLTSASSRRRLPAAPFYDDYRGRSVRLDRQRRPLLDDGTWTVQRLIRTP